MRTLSNRPLGRAIWLCAGTLGLLFLQVSPASAQLRVVTYNTTGAPRTGMEIVLRSIGEETVNGIARPIDILLLGEQENLPLNAPSDDTAAFATLLNTMYAGQMHAGQNITYAFGQVVGQGDTTQSIVYRTETIDLIAESAFGPVGSGSNQQPRATLRYELQPIGYDDTAGFYIFNSHYKADNDATSQNRRNAEAASIRSRANMLGEGAHVIYAGDFNMYTAGETAFQTLLATGNGRAFDPLNLTAFDNTPTKLDGEWSANPAVAYAHTQSPCASSCGGFTSGGMDDRFDFQLMTGEFLDGEGLSYISDSYHAFGNNGSTYNANINAASNSYVFNGVMSHTKPEILNGLRAVTDHLPVVADYQLPAIMNVVADTPPIVLNQGDTFNLNLTVSNTADVLSAIGADELDYSLTTSGDLVGSFLDQTDLALGGGNLHLVGFDTSTPGMKSGVVTVVSTSQAVQNGLVTIPINYEVLAVDGLAGDYNENGVVDAADYTVWRDNFGSEMSLANDDTPGVGQDDYERWRTNFNDAAGSGATDFASAVVPEPAAWLLLTVGGCWASLGRGKLRAWIPRP